MSRYFLLVCGLSFYFFKSYFKDQNFKIQHVFILSLVLFHFSERSLPNLKSQQFYPVFSRSSIVLGLIFRLMIHFELNLVDGARWDLNFFQYGYSILLAQLIDKSLHSPLSILPNLSKSNYHICLNQFLDSLLYSIDLCLSLCQHHTTLINLLL